MKSHIAKSLLICIIFIQICRKTFLYYKILKQCSAETWKSSKFWLSTKIFLEPLITSLRCSSFPTINENHIWKIFISRTTLRRIAQNFGDTSRCSCNPRTAFLSPSRSMSRDWKSQLTLRYIAHDGRDDKTFAHYLNHYHPHRHSYSSKSACIIKKIKKKIIAHLAICSNSQYRLKLS